MIILKIKRDFFTFIIFINRNKTKKKTKKKRLNRILLLSLLFFIQIHGIFLENFLKGHRVLLSINFERKFFR